MLTLHVCYQAYSDAFFDCHGAIIKRNSKGHDLDERMGAISSGGHQSGYRIVVEYEYLIATDVSKTKESSGFVMYSHLLSGNMFLELDICPS